MKHGDTLLGCIGRTPLVKLRFPDAQGGAQVWCKLEFMNPGGSLKDRMCLAIVESMEETERLRPGDTLVEASCGNTALSLAMIAAARGYGLKLVMPDTVNPERKRLLESFGAKIILTQSSNGMRGAVNRAHEIHESSERTFTINQFENPANPETHRRTTAMEILERLGRAPDVFVAGVGTGGTITGVGEVLKARNPSVRIVAVEPADSPILSGGNPGPHMIPGIGAGFIPNVLNTEIIDEVADVEFSDAVETVKVMAEKEGIFSGLSSGAAMYAALRQAERLTPDKVVVTVAYDAGERYTCFGP
ncbi:MAG: cysteine synthase A [Desulfomonilaceae bacterium]|nr:cysteine synthase A [Desulfomonilaceae bacterium]